MVAMVLSRPALSLLRGPRNIAGGQLLRSVMPLVNVPLVSLNRSAIDVNLMLFNR